MLLSVLVGLAASSFSRGEAYADWARELSPGTSARIAQEISRTSPQDKALVAAARQAASDPQKIGELKELLETRAWAQRAERPPGESAAADLARAKSKTNYAEGGAEQGNFIADALERLANLRGPRIPDRNPVDLSWLRYLMLGIIIVCAAILLFLGLRAISFQRSQRRRVQALMEDDEPEASVDEWLARADELAREGKHREAVRCLYFACLLRIDEAGIARFIRSQTNWEHLRRIQASPRRPAGLEFLPPTQAFDRVWYGFRVHGMTDVDYFRGVYQDLLDQVRAVPRR
jgi:hypothetical protein